MLHLPFSHTVTLIIITVAISLLALSNQTVMNRLIFGHLHCNVGSMTALSHMVLFMLMVLIYSLT
jgi:hypothetical protein